MSLKYMSYNCQYPCKHTHKHTQMELMDDNLEKILAANSLNSAEAYKEIMSQTVFSGNPNAKNHCYNPALRWN